MVKIYGPYADNSKGGRLFISTGKKRQIYARYIMEQHIGRKLQTWEEVHHKDENFLNNFIDNLEIKDYYTHASEHLIGKHRNLNGNPNGKGPKGIKNGMSVLNLEQIEYIRNSNKLGTQLAKELKVSKQTISRVRRGETYG